MRAQVMSKIAEVVSKQGLTQKKAAEILGIPQSKVSCLMNGKLSHFSLEHLFELLNRLDRDVEIIIRSKAREEKAASTQVSLVA